MTQEVAVTLSQRMRADEQTKHTPERVAPSAPLQQQNLSEAPLLPLLEPSSFPARLPAKLVERPQVLARLDSSTAYTLTLVVAPAGFGKSTLVNQWLTTHYSQRCSNAFCHCVGFTRYR